MTRRTFAMYLWTMSGKPAVTLPAKSPFADVKTSDSAYKALLWLRKQGVWTSTTYSPASALTRKAEAAMLYRLAGSPFDLPSVEVALQGRGSLGQLVQGDLLGG